MPGEGTTQHELIRQAVTNSLNARNRYVEQVVNDLTDELANARAQVGTAILRYKSLGSLPDNKLAGLKGLEKLDAEIKGIMAQLKRSHTLRYRTESKAAFRLGIYHGIEEFATAQLPVYRDLTPDGLDKLATKAFQIVDTDALDFLANYTTTLAGDVNRETTDGIMRTIRGAIATGKGVDDIVRDLGEVVKDKESFRNAGSKVFSKAQYRMEVIARTEVLRAHNLGKLKFHQAVGIQRLEWFTMGDERMCPTCGSLDGKQFPIDEFPAQPAHPQCRCGHNPAWPLVICGQGLLAASAAPNTGDACILPPHIIEGMAAAQLEEQKNLKTAFEGGDPTQLGALTMKQVQTLAKGQGVAIARTKADFLKLLADKGVDGSGLTGKALEATLKQYGIGALRSKDELVQLLVAKQAAFIQAQLQAQLLKDAATSATGLESMTVKELQNLAVQKGISLNLTKFDVIALLDQLEPGVDHSGLSGQLLIAAKQQFHIGPLKNKSQLIAAIEKVAGQELGDTTKQAAIDAAKTSAIKVAQQALDEATVKVVLPASPQGYADFLVALQSAEQALTSSSVLPQAALEKAAQELALKKTLFKQQVSALSANDLKTLAKETKIPHWQWASKGDYITLMSETDPVAVQAVKDAIEAKWQQWKLQQAGGGSDAKKVAEAAAQEAAAKAAIQAKATLEAKIATIHYPDIAIDGALENYVTELQEIQSTLSVHGSLLSTAESANYASTVQLIANWGAQSLNAEKVSTLKALAKAKKIPNWAFANKEQLITMLSSADEAAKQDVLQTLAVKVAGYGKATPQLKSGQALLAQLAPDAPVPTITGGQYASIDAQWSQVSAKADKHFYYLRDAKDLGGVHPKAVYADLEGNEWLFKPMGRAADAFLADADEMTYRVSRLVDSNAVEVRRVMLNGQVGTIQRIQRGLQAQKNYDGMDVSTIAEPELAQLLQHQVLDWLLSNHDSHSANFLRLTDGTVTAIDRAQAFKYFGRDKLSISYNPNNLPEHPTTLYNAIFAKVKAKGMTVDPRHTLAAIERIEAIDDNEYLDLLRAYAGGRPGDSEAFLQAALARKQSLREDFEAFYRTALNDKKFSFVNLLPAKKVSAASVLPKELEEAVSQIVERESWQGISIPFDRDMVEDVQLHLCTEQVPLKRGKVEQRTVYRLKMRPEKQQQIINIIEQAKQGVINTPEVGNSLAEDSFYARIIDGVRSVNGHLAHGSTRFNQIKLSRALGCETELRALLKSERIEVRDMAEHYLKAIDELTIYQRGGVTAAGRVAQLDIFRVRPGRISVAGKAVGPSFRVIESDAQLDQRISTGGKIAVKATGKSPGDLFKSRYQKLSHTGTQYSLEFDDGTLIRVRPFSSMAYNEHALKPGQNYYAISGDIEVIAPGKGTPEQLAQTFEKLRQLGIPAEVAPIEYREYLYLHQVAVANNLHTGDAGYRQLLQRLESKDSPITERVEALVQYWNTRLKVKDIRKLSRYNPLGEYQFDTQLGGKKQAVGYRRLSRFDIDLGEEMRGYNLMHQLVAKPAEDYVTMLDLALTHNGSLLSTTEKLRIGVQPGGMSPEADMASGGANYVFTRWRPDPRGQKSKKEMGFYLKPSLAQRTDTITYATDHYGRCHGDFVNTHRETTPASWKRIAETKRNNETIIKQNVTLLDNIDCIVLDSEGARQQMIATFQKHGVSELPDGRKVQAIIHVIPGAKKGYSG